MNRWLDEQVQDAVVTAHRLQARGFQVWLLFKRGEVLVSSHQELDGYELATPLCLPADKRKAELAQWISTHLRNVRCCP